VSDGTPNIVCTALQGHFMTLSKRKKKYIKYKIETKVIKQIKHYGTSPSRPKQTSHVSVAVSYHAAGNFTPYNPNHK
jgi:hypothetical protein